MKKLQKARPLYSVLFTKEFEGALRYNFLSFGVKRKTKNSMDYGPISAGPKYLYLDTGLVH